MFVKIFVKIQFLLYIILQFLKIKITKFTNFYIYIYTYIFRKRINIKYYYEINIVITLHY